MSEPTSGRSGDSAAPDIRAVIDESSAFPPVARLGALRAFHWLKLGWQDFKIEPMVGLFYGMCFALMGGVLKLVLANAPEYLSALTCGFLLIGPLLALGLYDVSRRIENIRSGMINSVFSMSGRWSNIGTFAVVLAVIMMVWARASLVIFALFYNKGMPTMEGFLVKLFSLDNLDFLVVYLCVGFIFASLVFAISWVSIPLMLDRDTDAITSMIISIVALTVNVPLTMIWGLIIVSFVVFGFMTWNIGFIFTMPIIGHATWHAYKEVVGKHEDLHRS
jgi:uncharacterized membrane protein